MKNVCFRYRGPQVGGLLLLALHLIWPNGAARGDDTTSISEQLRQAIQADLAGRSEERDAMIGQAFAAAPDSQLPRWLSGQIQIGDQWMSLNALQDRNKKLGWIEEYGHLRDEHANSLQGHYMLAQYCRRHGLKDRERLHWYAVLLAAPGHKEAIRSLGLRPYRGALLTADQIQWLKDTEEQWNEAKNKWEPELAEIRKSMLEGDLQERQAAIERLGAIDDLSALPFAEQALAGETEELALQLIALAGRLNDRASTYLLARYAVYADSHMVRKQAIEHLKGREWFTFLPMLMGAMASPVNVSFAATPVADGTVAVIRFRREGPEADYEQQLRISRMPASGNAGSGRNPRRAANEVAARDRAARVVAQAGARAYQQTIDENRRVQFWNGRIDTVLNEVTGHETDGRAESWWQWWQEYNDLYVPDEKPVYEMEAEILIRDRVATCECFLPGTLVWTETGPVRIERIRVGDRVLSQNPDTGELAYKLVLQTTVRPDAATVRIGIAGEEICATNGHPLWVAGEGWKMAKNLKPGLRLHTVNGSREITHIEEGPRYEAHNLLVADFQSFFVGNAKVLVHDNSIRQPTAAIVPGVTAEQAGVASRQKVLPPASK